MSSTRKHQLILLGAAALLGFALAAGPALANVTEDAASASLTQARQR